MNMQEKIKEYISVNQNLIFVKIVNSHNDGDTESTWIFKITDFENFDLEKWWNEYPENEELPWSEFSEISPGKSYSVDLGCMDSISIDLQKINQLSERILIYFIQNPQMDLHFEKL